MQVILLKDVPKVGRQFDVKNVADGFALNLLFPRRLAERATKEKVATLEARRAEISHLMVAEKKTLVEAIKRLDGTAVTLKAGKANEHGSLYKSVTIEEIALVLSKAVHAKITPSELDVPNAIKSIGEHKITIKADEDSAVVSVMVESN